LQCDSHDSCSDEPVEGYVSGNIVQLLGLDLPDPCQFQWWLDQIHPDDVPRFLTEKDALFKRGFATQDYRLRNKDQSYRWIRDEQRLVCDAREGSVEIVGSWTDVTERKNLEDQLRQALKMEAIGRLAGGVAHDFNNLLSVIIGYSQLVLQKDPLSVDVRESVDQILTAAHRAEGLTRQLLAFSRKKTPQTRVADLNEVVAGISKMLQRVIGEDITLSVECSDERSLVDAGEGSIEQVLMNLAVNARDAMPKGGRLSVSTGRVAIDQAGLQGQLQASAGDFVWLRVRDTGCGMTSVTQARIFEPFFTTKDVGKGTGMGLSTVFSIVRQHRGWIEVMSHPGEGSVFTIFWPAAEEYSTAVGLTDTVMANSQSGDETILLVEDEPAVRAMARKTLERLGYRVYEAGDGIAALSVWAQHRSEIDLLLTDIVMPEGLAGSDLAKKLRAEDPGLRVVLTSGYNSAGPDSANLIGGAMFIQKPYTLELLSQTIRTCLDARGADSAPEGSSAAPAACLDGPGVWPPGGAQCQTGTQRGADSDR
jgi:two-component system cell cycle sensor histidine kinase/response regulator CckA